MNTSEFIELIPIAFNSANDFKKQGVDLQALYDIFNSDILTTREKKTYLYSLDILTNRNKDTIWTAYMGDSMNKYADIPEVHYEYYVEGDK